MLGATGNVGQCIAQLLIASPLCNKIVVITRRKTDAFADLKISDVVVLARAMVAQSEQAFLAIARGDAPKAPTVKILE